MHESRDVDLIRYNDGGHYVGSDYTQIGCGDLRAPAAVITVPQPAVRSG